MIAAPQRFIDTILFRTGKAFRQDPDLHIVFESGY